MVAHNIHHVVPHARGEVLIVSNAVGIAMSEVSKSRMQQRLTDCDSDQIVFSNSNFHKSYKHILDYCVDGRSLFLLLTVRPVHEKEDVSSWCMDRFEVVCESVSYLHTGDDVIKSTITFNTPVLNSTRWFTTDVASISSIPPRILQELLDFHHQEQYNLYSC